MARFDQDPFPGTDYTKYLEWEKVTTPSGEVFYVVPNSPGYVLDPVASNATGRKVFRRNPKGELDEYQEQKDAQRKAIEQQEFNQSPMGQLLPVGASIGGLVAANQLIGGGTAAAIPALGGAAATGAVAPAVTGVATPTVIGASTIPGTAAAPTMLGNAAAMGALPLAAIGGGVALGAKGLKDLFSGKETKGWEGYGGRATLGIATGGLSEVARMSGLFGQKSTRDYARDNTDRLYEAAGDDTVAQAYVKGMRDQYDSAPVDPSKPFAGKYSSWDEYKKNGLEAGDLSGVYGNIDTFGPEWAKLSQDERVKVTQALIDEDLYYSSKGDVHISDAAKARQIKERVLAGEPAKGLELDTSPQGRAAAEGALVPVPMPRGGGRV